MDKTKKKGNKTISRRDFFKNTSLVVGGSLLYNTFPSFGHNKEAGFNPDLSGIRISGRYPHLTMFNRGSECGIGAVVPWADRLWTITYSPHNPMGNDHDGLYEITPDLQIIKRAESIGGTRPHVWYTGSPGSCLSVLMQLTVTVM